MRCAFGIGQIDFELRSHVYVPNRQRVDGRVEKCAGILQEQWFVAGRFKRRVERQRDEDRDVPVSDDLILDEYRLSLRPTTWNGTVNGGRALMILFAGLAFLPVYLWIATQEPIFREPLVVAIWLALIAFLMISNLATLSWGSIRPRRSIRLEAIALAGKTRITIRRKKGISFRPLLLVFEGDERVRATPKVDGFVR